MSYPQHYKTLGVAVDASPEEIKSVYYKLVKKYHPDTHKGDKKSEEKLKAINEAYNVLKDLAQRAEYDYKGRLAQEAADAAATAQEPENPAETPAYQAENTTPAHPKRRINAYWIFQKLLFIAIFVGYMFFLKTQANPEKPYDLAETLRNSSQTLRRYILSGSEYTISQARNLYNNGRWRSHILFFAVRHNRTSLLDFLLQHLSADVIDSATGESLLMAATEVPTTKILLAHGAPVNHVAINGHNALINAILRQDKEMVEVLLQAGADAAYILPDGTTALNIAAKQNNSDITALLLRYGAKIPWKIHNKKQP